MKNSDGLNALDTYYRMRDLTALTGVSRSTIYRWMESGHFPKPVIVGPNTRRWRSSELAEWQSRIRRQGDGDG